jgi:hypothetical protein
MGKGDSEEGETQSRRRDFAVKRLGFEAAPPALPEHFALLYRCASAQKLNAQGTMNGYATRHLMGTQ